MERVLSRLFLAYCKAWGEKNELEQWYHDGWQWLERFNDESKETSQQMASGTESDLRQAEHSLVRTLRNDTTATGYGTRQEAEIHSDSRRVYEGSVAL